MGKITYLLLAAVLATTSSCRKAPAGNSDGDFPIHFSIVAIESKSNSYEIISDVSQLESVGLSVFGLRYELLADGSVNPAKSESFIDNGEKLAFDAAGSGWNTAKQYYWTPGTSHKFMAIYPYCGNDGTKYECLLDESTHILSITGKDGGAVVCGTVTGTGDGQLTGTGSGTRGWTNICTDILYAVKEYPLAFDLRQTPPTVPFVMKHACAALTFTIRNMSGMGITSVEASSGYQHVEIKGLKHEATSLEISSDGVKWNLKKKTQTSELYIPNITLPIANGQTSKQTFTLIVPPQNFVGSDVKMYFRVVFDSSIDPAEYEVNLSRIPVGTADQGRYEYRSGYKYNYTFEITDNHVTSTVGVVPWIDDDNIILE